MDPAEAIRDGRRKNSATARALGRPPNHQTRRARRLRQHDSPDGEPVGARRRRCGRKGRRQEGALPRGIGRSAMNSVVDRWCTFWFTPAPAYTLGVVRMAFGVVTVVWALALLPDLYRVFGEQGVA